MAFAPVTTIIPMYQAAAYIGEALDSIRAQTLRPERVIVVDDGSSDHGPELVSARGDVELLRLPHTGDIGATVDAGLALIRSEYVAFLDADDRWTPAKTALQLGFLQADPTIDMVFGQTHRFVMTPAGEQYLDIIPGTARQGGLFRRELFTRIGPFSGTSGGHDFLDWYNRAQEAGAVTRFLPEVVFERRIHGANHGIMHRASQRSAYFRTIKEALDRRRASTL